MTDTLASALAAAQAEMPAVEKDATNPHFGNRFASLDHIIAKTRPVLNRHGLSIMQFPTVSDLGAPTLTTRLTHISGEHVETAMPLFLPKQDMQGLGSAITYARRYAWAAALGISSDEDDDGQTASRPADNGTASTDHASDVTPRPTNGTITITEPQQKRLFAIAKLNSVDAATVKQLVKSIAGVDSTAAVPKAKYDELVEAVEAGGVPF